MEMSEITERKRKVLDFMEKKIEDNEQEAEKLLLFMEGVKTGLNLGKEEHKAAG